MPNQSLFQMKIPICIEFHNETNHVLTSNFEASEPEEGCCLLMGKKKSLDKDQKRNIWEVTHIWNCRNIWGEKESRLFKNNLGASSNQKKMQLSKKNRFEIDPKDQIAAQKWARKNHLEVLCCAHSHPFGENRPSAIDLMWHKAPGLMVISNKNGDLKAWWIKNKFSFHRVKIKNSSLT